MAQHPELTSQEAYNDLDDATHAELVGMVKRYRREKELQDLEKEELMKQLVTMRERLSALELATTAPIQTTPIVTSTSTRLLDSIPIVTTPTVTFSTVRGGFWTLPSSHSGDLNLGSPPPARPEKTAKPERRQSTIPERQQPIKADPEPRGQQVLLPGCPH